MSDWKRVLEVNELDIGEIAKVEIDDSEIAIARTEGGFHAIGHRCPHYDAPLSEGTLCGTVLTCPYHNARFDVESGELLTPPALDGVPRYEVKVQDGAIYVGSKLTEQTNTPDTDDERVFLIVGGGAAGNAAAETLRTAGFGGSICIISADDSLPYDRPNLSKGFLSGEAKASWLPLRRKRFYNDREIETVLETVVAKVDPEQHEIETADGKRLKYDKLLLATGASPRVFDEAELQSESLHYLRSKRDAQAIDKAAESAKRVVILGASFIGLEVAASLAARDIEVHVVAPEDVPMSIALGESVGRRFLSLHEDHGIAFHMGTTASSITDDGSTHVALSNGETLEADLIVAGLGVEPDLSYLDGTRLVEGGGVRVNTQFQTSHDDIYAAGDIALYPDHRTGKLQRIEHWSVAEMQGRHAAKSMLGAHDPFVETPFFWTRQFGASFKYIGHARTWEDTVTVGDIESGDFLVGYVSNGLVLAVAASGYQDALVAMSEEMRAGTHITTDRFKELAS